MALDNKNIKSLDGIRGYAILMVVVSHLGLGHLVPGGFGVTVFFFVSGFLICKLLLFEIGDRKNVDFRRFYIRRIIRLYPALILFLICSLLIFIVLGKQIPGTELLAALFYFMNYNMVLIRPENFEEFNNVFNILWSLSIEEHFYIVFPFLLTKLYNHKSSFYIVSIATLFVCLAFRLYYSSILPYKEYKDYNYFLTHTRFDSIMYGCIIAYILFNSDASEKALKFLTNKFVFFIAIGMLMFTLVYRDQHFRETFRYTIQGTALCSIVITIMYSKNKLNKFFFSNRLMVFVGKLSYSLYLFHWLAYCLASQIYEKFTLQWYGFLLALTIVLSLSSYFYVEMPFVKFRKKFGSNV